MVLKQLDNHTYNTENLDSKFILFTKVILKWIIDLNIKCKTIKLLKDNTGEHLGDLGYGNDP